MISKPEDLAAFQQRTDCIAKEYGEFVSDKDPVNGDVHLNGRLTLSETPPTTAAPGWPIAPTFLNGVAVPVIMTVTVNFRLS